jgi:hypothetical protein
MKLIIGGGRNIGTILHVIEDDTLWEDSDKRTVR